MQEITRSTTAKLLATENISVVQNNVSTASFDIKHRILTLPMWKDAIPETEDHLIGHEVGHALYTPLDGWHDAVCEKGRAYKSYLNVVEDARIEKLIQRKYPGLRGSFIKSYKKLLADGLFGASIDAINKMPLIDRINTYFKCGLMSGVIFTTEEKVWLPRIESAETWEEVVAISDELFEHQREIEEQQKSEMQDSEEEGEDDLDSEAEGGEMSSDLDFDGDYEDDPTDYSGDTSEDDSEDDPMSFDDMFDEDGGKAGGENNNEPDESQTDKNLRDSISREIYDNFDGTVYNLTLTDGSNWHKRIISNKEIIKELSTGVMFCDDDYHSKDFILDVTGTHVESFAEPLYDKWLSENKNTVNHMVKEFEMRKSAAEHVRATVSKTGVLDTVKMNNYRLTDDIFKRVTVLPEGKNHGFIMYLDMSGSMASHMYNTVEQTLLLVHFCRQINVPFRVYGFTDNMGIRFTTGSRGKERELNQASGNDCYLLELFNESMSKKDIRVVGRSMLSYYSGYLSRKQFAQTFKNRDDYWLARRCMQSFPCLSLGGTPLDEAITYAIPLANEFRAQKRIDTLNTIFLTDGASHSISANVGEEGYRGGYGRSYLDNLVRNSRNLITVTNPHNNKTHKLRRQDYYFSFTEDLLRMYKDSTGSTVIGYRIENCTQNAMGGTYRNLTGITGYISDWDDIWKKVRTEGWIKVQTSVYDDCYILSSKHLAPVHSTLEDVASGSSKAKIRGAFKKSQGGSKNSRKMLTDLISKVA